MICCDRWSEKRLAWVGDGEDDEDDDEDNDGVLKVPANAKCTSRRAVCITRDIIITATISTEKEEAYGDAQASRVDPHGPRRKARDVSLSPACSPISLSPLHGLLLRLSRL